MAAIVTTSTRAFSSLIQKRVLVLVLALVQHGCRKPDECERALSRLERLAAKNGEPRASEQGRSLVLESCRSGRGSMDPVLRCAIDSASDDEANACIQSGLRDVVKPGAGSEQGRGINPLLER